MFDFSIDHINLNNSPYSKYEYVKAYQFNFKNSNGNCMNNLNKVNGYQTVEVKLNSNMNLKAMCCLSLLRSGLCDIAYDLPKDLYPTMLKCAIYTLNSEAVKVKFILL